MGFEGWDLIYVRYEPKAIDRFKNKSRILSDFGPGGLRLYNAFDGTRKASDIRASLGMDSVQFSKLMDFMISNQFIFEKTFDNSPQFNNTNFLSNDYSSESASQNNRSKVSLAIQNPENASRLNIKNNTSSELSSSPNTSSSEPDDSFDFSSHSSLSPTEQMIFDEYGDIGLKVFSLIDGQKSARQILEQTGVSETKLIQMLEFMNKNKIIKLDTPTTTRSNVNSTYGNANASSQRGTQLSSNYGSRGSRSAQRNSSSSEAGFSPMVENNPINQTHSPTSHYDSESKEMFLSIPSLGEKPSFFSKLKANALLALKFGKIGTSLLKLIDGTKDISQICIQSELSFHDLDIIFDELANNKLLQFKPLERDQIRERYGDDGLAVFKKFGRDGVLVYQLIGKSNTIRDIVLKSKLPKERAVDIILFVHSMLGLDVALDRDMIYRYISKKDSK